MEEKQVPREIEEMCVKKITFWKESEVERHPIY